MRLMTLLLAAIPLVCGAQNPIIQTWYTPDPAPYLHNDTVYLFVDHDEDEEINFFNMKDWQLYSSTDMVNWTYRGTPLTLSTFKWANQQNDAWASQAVCRNGKWYWYVAVRDESNGEQGIGVAVADRPEGPYTDPLGQALIHGAWGFIDPSVFVDDPLPTSPSKGEEGGGGRAYLFWGNNGLWYAELNDDMVSLRDSIQEIDTYDVEAFGPHKMAFDWSKRMNRWMMGFEEAPWIYKVGDTYYLEYAAGGVPEHWAYSTAKSIHGPWKYQGRVMGESPNSFTIHGGSIEYHNRWFMFYHCGRLPGGHGYHRSTSVEEYQRKADGGIPFIPFTNEGVTKPVRNLNPYERVAAVTMADSRGVKTDHTQGNHHWLTDIHNGDWTKVRSVDFGKGIRRIQAEVSHVQAGGTIEFRLDSPAAKPFARLSVGKHTQTVSTPAKASGIHDVFIRFVGKDGALFDFNWWQCSQ